MFRKDTCPFCGRDLHACVQCQFYDKNAYNECRETQAERVVDKEKGNFCGYFELAGGGTSGKTESEAEKARKKLEDIFRKK